MSNPDPDDSKRRALMRARTEAANPVLARVQYGLLGPCVDLALLLGVGVGHYAALSVFFSSCTQDEAGMDSSRSSAAASRSVGIVPLSTREMMNLETPTRSARSLCVRLSASRRCLSSCEVINGQVA